MDGPLLIGLLGRSRVGKDTVAGFIQAALPERGYRIWRFADPVKRAVTALYGFDRDDLETDKKDVVCPRRGVSPRDAMQSITRTYMERHGTGFFSEQLLYAWKQQSVHTGAPPHVIIPDVRYPDDVARIRALGGIVIKVERPDAPGRARPPRLRGPHRCLARGRGRYKRWRYGGPAPPDR